MPQTVLVTGSSGYIAKHIVLQLLNTGHSVRGTVRSLERGAEVADAVRPLLADPESERRLSFTALDLEKDAGWADAMKGVGALVHTASPFPLAQPDNEDDLIQPAVDGTLRALRAAKAEGVERVVMTSSIAAVTRCALPQGRARYDERDWTDMTGTAVTAYQKSKTLAERAAWEFVGKDGKGMALTAICPGFVLGPPLDVRFGTSLQVIQRILGAKDPAVPNVGYPIVDVRDVAAMHVKALATDASVGKRVIGAGDFMWFGEMAEAIKATWPKRRIVTRRAPDFLIRLLALFDKSVRTIVPELGKRVEIDNGRARELFGIDFIDGRTSVIESARYLIAQRLV